LPIDEEQLWDESGKRNAGLRTFEEQFKMVQEAGLKAVVDLHISAISSLQQKGKTTLDVPPTG